MLYISSMYIDDRVLDKISETCRYTFSVYEHERTVVVLGRSCSVDQDVYVRRCIEDGVPVLRRLGGGGSVVLCRGVLVVSAAGETQAAFRLREHMNAVNIALIRVLEDFGVKALALQGISDIACGEKKICGSSLHKKRNVVLYQGSLLLNPDLSLFERYLKHPPREPDYRQGRPHETFVSSLHREGYRIDKKQLVGNLEKALAKQNPWSVL
jgi:lipoate-protein ligase A